MAKKARKKSGGTANRSRPKDTGGLKGAMARASERSELKQVSVGPRGAVSTKPVGRVRTFFREVRIEMKKVTWPPRKELIKSTGVVIVAVAIAGVFIGVFDYLWTVIVKAVGMGG